MRIEYLKNKKNFKSLKIREGDGRWMTTICHHCLTECRSFDKDKREADLPDHLSESLNPDLRNVKSILEFIYNSKLINRIY